MHDIIISINDYDLPGVWEMAATEVFTGLKIIRNKNYLYFYGFNTNSMCTRKVSPLLPWLQS